MGRPQDNRLQRSGNTPLDPDHIETEVQTQPHAPRDEPGGGPVPEDNQPGHHPAHDQDKPDLEQFAEALGVKSDREVEDEPVEDLVAGDRDGDDADDAGDSGEPSADGERDDSRERNVPAQIRSVAASAIGLAEPVANVAQATVAKATQRVDVWLHLAERVERLEAEVAELKERLDR
jgi:hypothetical protein